jgi:hypothetical protein
LGKEVTIRLDIARRERRGPTDTIQKNKRGGIIMRKLVRIAVVLVIIMGTASGIASAKTLFVAGEDSISNATQTPANALAVNVKLTTYNNQCMTLTFSVEGTNSGGVAPGQIVFNPYIDGIPPLPTGFGNGYVYWKPHEDSYYDMTSFTWYRCGLKIGKHTVQIQYSPSDVGNTAYLRSRLLKIDLKEGKIVP